MSDENERIKARIAEASALVDGVWERFMRDNMAKYVRDMNTYGDGIEGDESGGDE